jgi:hypothetical protein
VAVSLAECWAPASCRLHRLGPILATQSEMEETMAAQSVAWDTGDVPGTYFRHMIKTADTGGRFSTLETKTNSVSCSEGASAVL